MQCGAHLHDEPPKLGEKLCFAGANGDVSRLRAFVSAGANLNQENASGLTVLQQAVLHDRPKVLKFLLDHHVDPNTVNKRGFTPRQLAEVLNSHKVLKLLPPPPTNGIKT